MCPTLKGHIDPRKEHGFLAAQPLRPTLKICHRHIFLTLRPRNDIFKGASPPRQRGYPPCELDTQLHTKEIAPRRRGAGFCGGYHPQFPRDHAGVRKTVAALALPLGELSPQVTERGLQPIRPLRRPLRRLRRHLSQRERQAMRSTGGVSLPLQKATRPVGENQIVMDENRLPCGH